jgi:hypothetical protein
MTWPTGQDTIRHLLASGDLQQVTATREAADALLAAATRHLDSARSLATTDPEGAYSLLYDAARKSLAAVLQVQGLRATSRGGHYALEQATRAQFTAPPPSEAFRPFGRLRRARNRVEYEPATAILPEDVTTDMASVTRLHQTAAALLEVLTVWQI